MGVGGGYRKGSRDWALMLKVGELFVWFVVLFPTQHIADVKGKDNTLSIYYRSCDKR